MILRPIDFPSVNKRLGGPKGWVEEIHGPCDVLPVYTDGFICKSCWTLTWRQRLAVLFGAKIWLHVASGETQPAVALNVDYLRD